MLSSPHRRHSGGPIVAAPSPRAMMLDDDFSLKTKYFIIFSHSPGI
jgi:hypothetical protein